MADRKPTIDELEQMLKEDTHDVRINPDGSVTTREKPHEFDKKLVEFTAVLDEFAANQRRQGIEGARLQKIVFARQIGEGQIQFEAVIDETAEAPEIYKMLARVEAAADRMKAKVDLSGHYGRILNNCALIEQATKKYAEMMVSADAIRAVDSIGKRRLQEHRDQDKAALRQQKESIKDCWEKIDETQKAIDECLRILGGEDPFVVLADQIAKRLDALRGSRSAAAA